MCFKDSLLFLFEVLGAEFLILGSLYVSCILARRLLGRAGLVLGWLGATVVGMWLATAGFHLLLLLHQFNLPVALLLVGSLVAGVRLYTGPFDLFRRSIARDFSTLASLWRRHLPGPYRWLAYLFLSLVLLVLIRAATLPPLGWDGLTYHGVKAGLWVQGGGPVTLEAPGGWGAYRNYPGGGEVFYAWAALPFHNDLLVGLVDGVQWLLLALAVYGLSRQLGVIGSFSWTAAAYVFSLPALHLSIGSGYIEPALMLSLTAGLVFLIRFLKQGQGASLFLALLALGMASGMKFTLLPVAAISVMIILLAVVVAPTGGENTVRWFWVGSLAALILVLPWLVRNIQETGYPFSPLSVEIAGLKLGQLNETMQWFQQRLDPSDSSLSRELKVLGRIFRPPTVSSIHLSLLTLIPIFLFPAMLWRLLRAQPLVGCLLALIVPVVVAPLYGSQFSVVRLLYGGTLSRFLLPVVPIVVAASFLWCEKGKLKSALYAGVMALGALVHLLSQSFFGWARFEFLALPVWMAVLLVLVVAVKGVSRCSGVAQRSTLLMVPLLLLPALDSYRGSIRQTAIEESLVRHERARYWTRAVKLADTLPGPGRIAVTSGPFQQADSWALYLFLGRGFQNQLFYIPITSSGEIVDFGPERRREAAANFDAWWSRIVKKKISHVMSFQPASLELSWLEAHPNRFRRLEGSRVGESAWGFYEVLTAGNWPSAADN